MGCYFFRQLTTCFKAVHVNIYKISSQFAHNLFHEIFLGTTMR